MPPPAIDEAAARVQAGCPTGRTGAGIPGRFGIRTQRSSDPQRSVSDESPRRAAIPATRRKTREKKQDEFPGHCIIRPETYRAPGDRTGNAAGERAERPQVRERGRLVRPVSGLRGSAFPGRNAGRTRNICQTRLHTLLHQPFWEVFSAHTSRWLETLWHGAGWKILALGTFGILMHMIGLPNTFPYRNPDKKQGSFL